MEIAVISGKGGTGKSSISSAFVSIAKSAVVVDCDVDASNLYLLFSPLCKEEQVFVSGSHERGVPCNTLLCPKCDCHLVRKIVLEIPEDTVLRKKENKKDTKPFPKVNSELCMAGECKL